MKDIPRACTRFAAALRSLREDTGLSLVALGEKTPYSKSTWQRYLSAASLPPWSAVEALCRLAGQPQDRWRAQWELAEAAWSGRDTVEPQDRDVSPQLLEDSHGHRAAHEPVRRTRRVRTPTVALVAGALMAASAAVTALLLPGAHPSAAASKSPPAFQANCTGPACTGQNPSPTLCGVDPQTLLNRQLPDGVGLEVRYNPLCHAAWARFWNTQVGDTLTLSAPHEASQQVSVRDQASTDAFLYTPMLATRSEGGPLRVCFTPVGGRAECFDAPAP
jgi:transcriptional regulator with XRE-family HTH domain